MTETTTAPAAVDLTKSGIVDTIKADTGRRYALHARSRNLTTEQNNILTRAGNGHAVDVVAFRKAVTAALSLAATRAGQSMARREWTREARHLLYWADAIIDNHLAGLPTYEPGQRSPRIAELELEVEHAGVVNQSLTSDLTTLKQAASDERRRLCAEIDDAKATVNRIKVQANKAIDDANAEIKQVVEARRKDHEELSGLYLEVNSAHAALEYAFGLLNDEQQSRLAGFRDGYAQRVIDVPGV